MTATGKARLRADGSLLLVTAMWGGTFVVVKDALDAADPLAFLTLRFTLGAVAAGLWARSALKHLPSLRAGALLGVFLFLGFALQTFGLGHTTPSRSAFITGLAVVVVPLVSWLLFRRAPKPTSLVGVALAALGIYWLTGGPIGEAGSTLKGDLLTLGCAAAFAFQIVLTERYAPHCRPSALVTSQLAVTAALSAACLPFFGARIDPSPALWGAVLFTGLFASTLAFGVQAWAQARTTAVRAALIFALEPVFAALYSVGLEREVLGARELLGGALILTGVLFAEVGGYWLERRRASR